MLDDLAEVSVPDGGWRTPESGQDTVRVSSRRKGRELDSFRSSKRKKENVTLEERMGGIGEKLRCGLQSRLISETDPWILHHPDAPAEVVRRKKPWSTYSLPK